MQPTQLILLSVRFVEKLAWKLSNILMHRAFNGSFSLLTKYIGSGIFQTHNWGGEGEAETRVAKIPGRNTCTPNRAPKYIA